MLAKTESRRWTLSALCAWVELGEQPSPLPIALRRSVTRSFKNVAQQVGAQSSNAMIEEEAHGVPNRRLRHVHEKFAR